jgi:DNA (cytosine-5)-methyltransferase 1
VCDDFIKHNFNDKYDAIISNPPYFKLTAVQKKEYKNYVNTNSENIYCWFLEKYSKLADEIMCVIPKTFLMIPDCNEVREIYQLNYRVKSIYDYGVNYFKDVFIEIISVHFTKDFANTNKTHIVNLKEKIVRDVPCDYIYHDTMWLLYRDEWFDEYINTLKLNTFDYYRDRQLTNKFLSSEKSEIWVVRSKNLSDDGKLQHIDGYDRYIKSLEGFVLKKYFGRENIIFTNFTYNTRAAILPKNCTINGSLCILFPKEENLNIDLSLYSTDEFRRYYAIVKNKSKFTINVDANSIYYIGVKKNDKQIT